MQNAKVWNWFLNNLLKLAILPFFFCVLYILWWINTKCFEIESSNQNNIWLVSVLFVINKHTCYYCTSDIVLMFALPYFKISIFEVSRLSLKPKTIRIKINFYLFFEFCKMRDLLSTCNLGCWPKQILVKNSGLPSTPV